MNVWVVIELLADEKCQCNGVFSTQENAVAACRNENSSVVRFEIDRDMTDFNEASDYDVIFPLRKG